MLEYLQFQQKVKTILHKIKSHAVRAYIDSIERENSKGRESRQDWDKRVLFDKVFGLEIGEKLQGGFLGILCKNK